MSSNAGAGHWRQSGGKDSGGFRRCAGPTESLPGEPGTKGSGGAVLGMIFFTTQYYWQFRVYFRLTDWIMHAILSVKQTRLDGRDYILSPTKPCHPYCL